MSQSSLMFVFPIIRFRESAVKQNHLFLIIILNRSKELLVQLPIQRLRLTFVQIIPNQNLNERIIKIFDRT